MKTIIITILLFFSLICSSQEVKLSKPKQPFVYPTALQAVGKSVKTTMFVKIKDKQYTIYKGSKGGYFYITETIGGAFKKNYIKI